MAESGEKEFTFQLPVLNNSSACSTKSSLFTPLELEILSELRQIKGEVREIRGRLAEVPHGQGGGLIERLQHLRARWQERSRAFEDASRRRMIALGHAKPS